MKQAAAEHGVGSVSPIARHSKHETTPSRPRRKTSRKDQGTDVHTTCSTPNQLQFEVQSNIYSPSDTFPYSQENCPEVVWDYTSPKLPKGATKKELKITVDEFLKNLTHHQAPECNTQTSQYIKLLEKWMAKQNTPVCVKKPIKNLKRNSRMRSRRIYEDMKKLVTSIQQQKEKLTEEKDRECTSERNAGEPENNIPETEKHGSPNQSNTSLNKKSFLEGNTNDNDSIEELWGEADNSFIIKATQHLDCSSSKYIAQNNNFDIVSTIPETVTATTHESKYLTFETEQSTDKNSLNKAMLDSDYQAQVLLTQIMNCEWESDSENEDLENGFIMGDDALSLIPDEILCGVDTHSDENVNQNVAGKSKDKEILNDKELINSSADKKQETENWSCELSFGATENDKVILQTVDQSEIELFNNFEDESFGDESVLCKPEVLSWIDEVESKLSQSQTQKCTPEEIEKKKEEAIQRRKRNQSRT